jgi:hypothetical protein
MAEMSKTARASMKGGQVAKVDPYDTNEKKIAELMKQRDPSLGCVFVTRMDFIDALIEEYKKEKAAVAHLAQSCSSLLKRAEEAEEKLRMEVATNNELDDEITMLKNLQQKFKDDLLKNTEALEGGTVEGV